MCAPVWQIFVHKIPVHARYWYICVARKSQLLCFQICKQIFQIACKYRYTSLQIYAQSDLMPSTLKNYISSNFCERYST